MAEGTSTFMGLAPALLGESEIKQQTAATDILTLTGAASQSGDFIVCQNSTGTEYFVVSSSGQVTLGTAGLTIAGVAAFTGAVTMAGVSSTTSAGLTVSVTSTGAIAEYGTSPNAIVVASSSKSVLHSIIQYQSGNGTEVGTCNSFFSVVGSKAPSYLLSVGATKAGIGAAVSNGFFTATNFYYVSAPSTAIPMGAIKILAGSKAFYIPCIPDTGMAAS